MLSLSSIYFLVTGIQFWITEYLQEVLLVDKATVFTYFSLISITGPILGVVVGNKKIKKNNQRATFHQIVILRFFFPTLFFFCHHP